MAILDDERAYAAQQLVAAEASIEEIDRKLAGIEGQLLQQRQIVSAAGTEVSSLQARLSQANHAVADAQQAVVARQEDVDALAAKEPDPEIDRGDHKPPIPNPAYKDWKNQMDTLVAKLEQAKQGLQGAIQQVSAIETQIAQAQQKQADAQRTIGGLSEQATDLIGQRASHMPAVLAAQAYVSRVDTWIAAITRQPADEAELAATTAELLDQLNRHEDRYRQVEDRSLGLDEDRWRLTTLIKELESGIADTASMLAVIEHSIPGKEQAWTKAKAAVEKYL